MDDPQDRDDFSPALGAEGVGDDVRGSLRLLRHPFRPRRDPVGDDRRAIALNEGKAAVVEMLAGYWRSFRAIEHEFINIYGADDHFALKAKNHYVRLDGR